LVDFIAGQPWDIEVQSIADAPADFEAWIHTGPLPDLLGPEPSDLPPAPYLCAPDDFTGIDGAFNVGVVWAGSRFYLNDEYRSTRLADWAPVLEVPGVTFYSLQLGPAAGELEPWRTSVTDLGPRLHDWTESAAALMKLDLVVSVDSAVAHLAGALGRSVWMCLPVAPDPRWMLERADTPLYGSARLFRQPRAGDWSGVFGAVAVELRKTIQ
jgi:hypothetical protein